MTTLFLHEAIIQTVKGFLPSSRGQVSWTRLRSSTNNLLTLPNFLVETRLFLHRFRSAHGSKPRCCNYLQHAERQETGVKPHGKQKQERATAGLPSQECAHYPFSCTPSYVCLDTEASRFVVCSNVMRMFHDNTQSIFGSFLRVIRDRAERDLLH